MGACGSKEASRPARQPVSKTHRTAPQQSAAPKKQIQTSTANATANANANAKAERKASAAKKTGIKSETRRLGTKSADQQAAPSEPESVPVVAKMTPAPEPEPEPASSRQQQQKKGQLGKKLDAERRKNNKDFAMEEYVAKTKPQA
ncbi:hypothetical protein PMKS-002767 [Pichia membranifaciens]|uniref:Uncharacterized protein n=1 Tax=Pichia membranifaciens TaxID=4926 RepID=A0A1Q2YID9_9ASCO|nr:hypothetical protein PMKS-002767 [Pichia membranifaciens]